MGAHTCNGNIKVTSSPSAGIMVEFTAIAEKGSEVPFEVGDEIVADRTELYWPN